MPVTTKASSSSSQVPLPTSTITAPPCGFQHGQISKLVGELIGTYFLVLTVGCNVLTGSVGAALSIGAVLMVMVYAIGPVSGAHLNPAVTLTVLLSRRGKIRPPDAAAYCGVQLLGAVLAGLTYVAICGNSFTLAPVGRFHWAVAASTEVLYSTALCYVVLNVATVASKDGNGYFGLAIGFTVVSAALGIGGISGCSLNPAVSVGAIVSAMLMQGAKAAQYFALYFLCPFVGSVLGAVLFQATNPEEYYAQ